MFLCFFFAGTRQVVDGVRGRPSFVLAVPQCVSRIRVLPRINALAVNIFLLLLLH